MSDLSRIADRILDEVDCGDHGGNRLPRGGREGVIAILGEITAACGRCEAHEGLFIHGVKKSAADGGVALAFETNHVRCWVNPGCNSDLWKDTLKEGERTLLVFGLFCAGCGYLICGDGACAGDAEWGQHYVVDHQME